MMLRMALCLSLICATLSAAPQERRLKWDELSHAISNEGIALTLPDGTSIRGIGRGVLDDELIADVGRTSNSRLHPKGRTRIPRAQVSVIDVYSRPDAGSNRGAAIGVGLGVAAASPAAFYLGEKNHEGLGVLVAVAGGVAGWLVGHHYIDHGGAPRHFRIQVIP